MSTVESQVEYEQMLGELLPPLESIDAPNDFFEWVTGKDIPPSTAYSLYRSTMDSLDLSPSFYFSTSITSGGFIRPDGEGNVLPIGEIIGLNCRAGREYVEGALPLLKVLGRHGNWLSVEERDIVLPTDMGKMPGWSQADFLLFWFNVVSGVPASAAYVQRLDMIMRSALGADVLPAMADKSDPAAQAEAYAQFVNAYHTARHTVDYLLTEFGRDAILTVGELTARDDRPYELPSRDEFRRNSRGKHGYLNVITTIDTDMSLGGRSEVMLAGRSYSLIGSGDLAGLLNSDLLVALRDRGASIGVPPGEISLRENPFIHIPREYERGLDPISERIYRVGGHAVVGSFLRPTHPKEQARYDAWAASGIDR